MFYWIPEHREKNLNYYSDLLRHEKSIIINTISDRVDTSKIIYHSVYLVYFIFEENGALPLLLLEQCQVPPFPIHIMIISLLGRDYHCLVEIHAAPE